MDMLLTRKKRNKYGIFGVLSCLDPVYIPFQTLEHAYEQGNGFYAKIPEGIYSCQKGEHQLLNRDPFKTFEVMNVPHHSGILIHVGNYNADSEGCILLGEFMGEQGIYESADAFSRFMRIQDTDSFQLTIQDGPFTL